MHKKDWAKVLTPAVLISALGYFVDIYDLLLFGIVRVASLRSIGVAEKDLMDVGIYLINHQMAGMLLGGVLWGIAGDKRGRVSVLFGSILIYSIANILNAFVHSVETYGILRFLAGVGLAGELGAAITLVSETLNKEHRGIGTTIVASVGILGAVFAGLIGEYFSWQTSYLIGGLMGLALLVARMSVYESGMFKQIQDKNLRKGDLRMLFHPLSRLRTYLCCILIGVPIWFVVGILITFSPELSLELGVQGKISASRAILYCYAGLSFGDLVSGYLSQIFKSRLKVVFGFLAFTFLLVAIYLFSREISELAFYSICALLGFATGYWAVFITLTAEQFGTNLRATVATTVPNFVRGSVVLLTSAFQFFQSRVGSLSSCAWVGGCTLIIAMLALTALKETFGKDLNYVET